MHAKRLLHRILSQGCVMHRARLRAVMSGVESLLRGHRLSIAGLGRSLRSNALTKHTIKRMDRLAGNVHVHRERLSVYQTLSRRLLGERQRPVLIVDWSDARSDRSLQLLRASMVLDGRSVTVYEEIHPLSQFDNRGVRARFLRQLQKCLPVGCRPIVVSDAGFRVSWYEQIEALGWDWVGRVRGRALCELDGDGCWRQVSEIYQRARKTPRALGRAKLTESRQHRCYLHLVRQPKRGRQKTTMYGGKAASTHSQACASRHREPWLLATSLDAPCAKKICQLYAQRTQIEGSFRDLKNTQWGFNLRAHRSRCPKRLEVLVMLATLATFVAWLVGFAATTRGLHRRYQANTSRRRVLSIVYLGLQVLSKRTERFTAKQITDAYRTLCDTSPDVAYA